jgi:hypothetical protein
MERVRDVSSKDRWKKRNVIYTIVKQYTYAGRIMSICSIVFLSELPCRERWKKRSMTCTLA